MCCLFLLSWALEAQNWQVLNTAYRYHYYTRNPAVISASIWVDSVKNNTAYLNRLVSRCDTCVSAQLANNFYDTAYVLSNQPGFLQRKMQVLSNGGYHFTDYGNVVFQTQAAPHTPWLFDSLNQITARLLATQLYVIFSTVDSVQYIGLSSGDTVILSRYYGLLQYPVAYGSHLYYRLAGIEGLNKGLQNHTFKDFFTFSAGDVFQYSTEDQNYVFTPPLFTQGIKKVQILRQLKNTDTLSYQVKTSLLDSQWIGGNTPVYTFSTSIDTLVFVDSARHFTNLYSNQLVPVAVPAQFAMITTPSINQLQNDIDSRLVPVKRYGVVCPNTVYDSTHYGVASSVDTLNPFLYLIRNGVLNLGREAKVGLGISSDVYNNYDEIKTTCLTGYVKGTDTVGTITPDAALSAIDNPLESIKELRLSPNPTRTSCCLQFYPLYTGQLYVFNTMGQIIFSENLYRASQYKLNTATFGSGIYLIKCHAGNDLITQKLIIE